MRGIAQDLSFLSSAIGLRAQRHQVLASNIANADTPGYKARDFDFRSAMQTATGNRNGAVALAQTSGRHLAGNGASGAAALQFRRETQSAVDGNTVDMDVERAQITDNAMQYEILTRLIGDRLQGIKAAMASAQS